MIMWWQGSPWVCGLCRVGTSKRDEGKSGRALVVLPTSLQTAPSPWGSGVPVQENVMMKMIIIMIMLIIACSSVFL